MNGSVPAEATETVASRRRIFIGLSETAGYLSSLAAGLREVGEDARLHNLSPDALRYASTKRNRLLSRLVRLRFAPPGSLRARAWTILIWASWVQRRVRAALLFPRALLHHDVFVLTGSDTFLGGWELALLHRLNKKLVVVFLGSDHRPAYLSGKNVGEVDGRRLARETRRLARNVRRAERFADAIVALPSSAQLHARPFIHFLAIGVPFAPPRSHTSPAMAESDERRPVRVLHCPTHPAKGSDRIRAAVEGSRSKVDIEYLEIAGRPNAEVLEAIEWCDFVVDELYSDSPMARFATEAAYFAKPAVVGTYLGAGEVAVDLPEHLIPPSVRSHPDALEETIARLATNADLRARAGRAAREFVITHWSAAAVARRVVSLLDREPPSEWVVHPERLTYVRGWGASEETVRAAILAVLEQAGVGGLCLPPRSPLLGRMLALAGRPMRAVDPVSAGR